MGIASLGGRLTSGLPAAAPLARPGTVEYHEPSRARACPEPPTASPENRLNYRGIDLDPFQVRSIDAIERGDTLIVAAPTGAGKTVIAEYAIESYLESDRRIIYTAPIKALSNQKFRDFGSAWGDQIGIVTGDVSINPLAPVLIMTTEIFRNTIFDDPARLHDVEYVILDEVHFINDLQRGTVWEESLIFAPPHIGFICLSATVPNLDEFAAWIRAIRPDREVAVISEAERPVPLEHHLWLPGSGEAHLSDLQRLAELAHKKGRPLRHGEAKRALGAGKRDPAGQGDLVAHLQHLGRLPCLYFCFSRVACEKNAERYSRADLLDHEETAVILQLFDALCVQFGLEDDPGAERMRRLLAGGVSFHHAGMLPMLKEVVERVFNTGLLKLLFTTETFAVGVNMPACTAVFESLEKYDGVDTRYLLTREYLQMAGRAGRRGIDERGYVYARIEHSALDLGEIERIVNGEVEPTRSQFNLSYSSVLNLYQQFGEDIFSVCHKSFGNFQSLSRVSELEAQLGQLEQEPVPEIDCLHDKPKSIASYRRLNEELQRQRGRTDGERSRIHQRYPGKKHRRELERALRRLEQPLERLRGQVADSLCHQCPRKKACSRLQHQIDEQRGGVAELRSEILRLKHFQRDQIAKRLTILREFGYLDERGLTAKGEMAAALYGFEMVITELFFGGFFEDVTEEEIGCLMVAVVFESKRSTWYQDIADRNLGAFLHEGDYLLRTLARRERDLRVENGTEPLDASLTQAALAWLRGDSLQDLGQQTDASAGDIVRTFRHAVDLMRQFKRAIEGYPLLADRLQSVITRMRRDEVDAEKQLRLGHLADLAAAAD